LVLRLEPAPARPEERPGRSGIPHGDVLRSEAGARRPAPASPCGHPASRRPGSLPAPPPRTGRAISRRLR